MGAGKTENPFELIDWRTRTASTLVKKLPESASGAPPHDVGSLVLQSTIVKGNNGELLAFTLPSASAMALSIAISAAERGTELRQQITFSDATTTFGHCKSVDDQSNSNLFDYFECYFTCAVFSFLALEVFANEVISILPKIQVTTDRGKCGKKQKVTLRAEPLEAKASTEEKLAVVIPALLEKATPKGKSQWEAFKKLQRARNEVVHLKAENSNPRLGRPEQLEQGTLLSHAFEADIWEMPKGAVEMISYFEVDRLNPKWLSQARARVEARSSMLPRLTLSGE